MIDLNWLNSQPACQLALFHLKHRRATPHSFQCHLLTLLLDYLDGLPANPDPKGYMADLQQAVHELAFPGGRDSQEWAAALMCGDHEQLRLDLEENPGREREVLAEHLGQLHREMQDNTDAVGSLLAENVFNSLQ
jgi:hypothetical protein